MHVDYGRNRHKASYSILDGERLAGNLATKHDKVVCAWIKRNRKVLMKAWKAITGGTAHEVFVAKLEEAD